jgi:methionine biosynthesis protein MetW
VNLQRPLDPDAPALAPIRPDLRHVAEMVTAGARVLDIGCGDGALLKLLAEERGVDGRGIEIRQEGVNACVANGLSAIQGDADTDLAYYPDGSFDFVVLSLTLQATRDPRQVLLDLVRIGRRAIVSFPNFGHWRARWHLLVHGRMPTTGALPDSWWSTPNIHLCTIRDFVELAADLGIVVEKGLALNAHGRPIRLGAFANTFGETGVFLLRKG